MSARPAKDLILWGALGCALVSTAHAEYTLATATHVNEYVALAVPGALDLYVIRALQQRKDVALAVLVMVAANVTSHLLTADVIPVHWTITAAVGALAPLILGRIYYLKHRASEDTGAVSAPAPAAPAGYSPQVSDSPWAAGFHLDGCDGMHQHEGYLNCTLRASALADTAPDHVPAHWMDQEYPETHPSAPTLIGKCDLCELDRSECGHWPRPIAQPRQTSAVPYLAPVPDLPPEYADTAVHEETSAVVLYATDWAFLMAAENYIAGTDKPTVKGLRRELSIGQDRAERLLSHLGVRP